MSRISRGRSKKVVVSLHGAVGVGVGMAFHIDETGTATSCEARYKTELVIGVEHQRHLLTMFTLPSTPAAAAGWLWWQGGIIRVEYEFVPGCSSGCGVFDR